MVQKLINDLIPTNQMYVKGLWFLICIGSLSKTNFLYLLVYFYFPFSDLGWLGYYAIFF